MTGPNATAPPETWDGADVDESLFLAYAWDGEDPADGEDGILGPDPQTPPQTPKTAGKTAEGAAESAGP